MINLEVLICITKRLGQNCSPGLWKLVIISGEMLLMRAGWRASSSVDSEAREEEPEYKYGWKRDICMVSDTSASHLTS